MKRFLVYLLLFPALATASWYAVLYVLTGAVVDSLAGPALGYLLFIGPALVVAVVDGWASKGGALSGVIAATSFAYGAVVLAAVWLDLRDVWIVGLVGGIPAAACSWLSRLRPSVMAASEACTKGH